MNIIENINKIDTLTPILVKHIKPSSYFQICGLIMKIFGMF